MATRLRDATISCTLRQVNIQKVRAYSADTKLEFGFIHGELVVADEMFTPDSSRFWSMEDYEPGNLKSFDKQYLREYLDYKLG